MVITFLPNNKSSNTQEQAKYQTAIHFVRHTNN